MAYRLRSQQRVAAGLTRIARKQLKRAAADLTAAGARLRRDKVHAARKRVKKVRALVRLIAPALPKRTVRKANAHLQTVSRRLGRIADTPAALEALDRLARAHRSDIPKRTALSLRRALQQGDRAIRRAALEKKVGAQCVHVLLAEARRAQRWTLEVDTVPALLPGLETSTRRARKAMNVAWRHPDAGHLHAWRRRVKDEWLQLRLLEPVAGTRLAEVRQALESLDGVLGEYHDLALLRRALERDETLTRDQTAAVLRVMASARRKLRRRAKALGVQVYGEIAA